ncbi:MAG: dihydroorotase [Cucumibacter sp.]
MDQGYDLVIAGATVVNHDGKRMADVGVAGGRIAALGDLRAAPAAERVEARGLHILPGVIDTQVHFREPGAPHKEDMESGSLSAVMGGVTAVFEMPNTEPPTTTSDAFIDKLARARGRMHCDYAFYVGGTSDNVSTLRALEQLPGCAGVKVFMGSSTGNLLVEDDEAIEAILANISRRAAFHAEDEGRLKARAHLRVVGAPESHPVWRSVEAALGATRRLVRLARKTGKRIHILHVSTGEEIEFLSWHKDIASVELTPHHLTLDQSAYEKLGAFAQMNPPIRDRRQRAALWQGLASGVADILGSDHAPHTVEEKSKEYPNTPSGMPGVQTLVPVMLDHVNAGRLSIERFVDLTSHGPHRLFGIAGKGRIAVGYDADLTIVDLSRKQAITNQWIASRAGWTPYDGVAVTGWPVGTFIRGQKVMWEGELVTAHAGQPIRFLEAMPPST